MRKKKKFLKRLKTNRYWFRPKLFGYGCYPITWEGWLATAFLLGLVFLLAFLNNIFSPEVSAREGLRFLLEILGVTFIATLYFKPRTKGKFRWRWGKK